MKPENFNRLQEILEKKIQQVQTAELSGTWQQKTIKQETEFLMLIKNLIAENQELSLNQTEKVFDKKFIDSFIRELEWFGLEFNLTMHNEVRLFKKGFTAFNE